jgi:hypothetical protein
MAAASPHLIELLELNDLSSEINKHKSAPRPVNYLQLWRYCRKGVKTASGLRIKLAHKRIAGRLYSSRQAWADLLADQNNADQSHFDKVYPAAPNPREVQRRVEKLKQEAAAI